jgi:hypothetical protein
MERASRSKIAAFESRKLAPKIEKLKLTLGHSCANDSRFFALLKKFPFLASILGSA